MDTFNGDIEIWTTYGDLNYLNPVKELKIDDKCTLDVEKRIGSQSTMAQVFKVDVDGVGIAAKLLPITNKDSISNNEKEIMIATMASDLVKNKKSKYFPIVYDSILCEETHFYNDKGKSYYEKSKRFQEYDFLLSLTTDEDKINKIMSYKKKFVDAEIAAKKVFPNRNIVLTGKVKSHILFSELASCDLKYYLENYSVTDEELLNIVKKVIKGIRDLHMKLKVVHNDLHLGNILITNLNHSIIPLIHDFGKSYFSDFENEYDRKDDLLHFLGKISEYSDICNDLIDYTIDSDEKYISKSLIESFD